MAFTQEELNQVWKETGKQHGFTEVELRAARKDLGPVNREEAARKSLLEGVARLSKEKSRFTWLELLRYTAEEAQTKGISIDDVRTVVRNALQHSQELVRLKDVDGERNWTTKENLEVERRMLEAARRLNKKSEHVASYGDVSETLKNYPTMREEQKAGLRHICVTSGDVACVNGASGSGKTFMLEAAREVWEPKGISSARHGVSCKQGRAL